MLTVAAPASFQGDALAAEFRAAGLAVENDELYLRGRDLVVVPLDEADRDVVQQVIDAHVPPEPPPDPDDEFRDAVTAAVADEPAGSPLRKLADALLGASGPGAEPRRPT